MFLQDPDVTLYHGDALEVLRGLPDESVHMCVTSPPYWGLRDYGIEGQIGLEPTPAGYITSLVQVFAEVRRVLRRDGTLWLNLGDSFSHGGNGSRDAERWPKQSRNDHRVEHPKKSGAKPKDLLLLPARVALALQDDGWWLRSTIIWAKPNPMPESVTDRPTTSHEYVFLLAKSRRYYFDAEAVRESATWERWGGQTTTKYNSQGASKAEMVQRRSKGEIADRFDTSQRNCRSVWTIATEPYPEAHFATFPTELARRCILAGCPEGGTVLDPFAGSGTTCHVARKHGRRSIGIDLNSDYLRLAADRLAQLSLLAETT